MIYSMTGFAAISQETGGRTLVLDLRTVNHRYLDISFRLDDTLRALEPVLREAIAARLTRGKVDCRLAITSRASEGAPLQLDSDLVLQLVRLGNSIGGHLPDSRPLSVADILRWPGVVGGGDLLSAESLRQPVLDALHAALDELAAARGREGEKLKTLLLERAAGMEALVAEARPWVPKLMAAQQERLAARLREAGVAGDEDRIRQELVLFAQKIDVDEELSRLQAHIGEVRRVLDKGGVVGKRLDFLMQELNREANTLGSKSVATETSRISMELKILIEQMREQIQNIE